MSSPSNHLPEFPDGFTGDMEALHKHHQSQLTIARSELEAAKKNVASWERLEEASSRLAAVAMHKRWAMESATSRKEGA